MFVEVPKESSAIWLPENFARLVDVTSDGSLVFKVCHAVKQSDIVRKNFRIVRVNVVTKVMQAASVVVSQDGSVAKPSEIVKNVQKLLPNARAAAQSYQSAVIAQTKTDNAARLDSSIVNEIKNAANLRNIPQLFRSVMLLKSVNELNAQNENEPLLQVNREVSESYETDTFSHLLQKCILQLGIDPSVVTSVVDDSVLTADEAVRGVFLKSTQMNDWETPKRIFRRLTEPSENVAPSTFSQDSGTSVLVLETQFHDEAKLETTIAIPAEKVLNSDGTFKQVFFRFDLLGENNVIVQQVQGRVDVLRHLEMFQTPKKAPIVKYTRIDGTGTINLQVKQTDVNASSVKIYKKDFWYSTPEVDSYHLVAERELTFHSGFESFSVDVATSFTTILRVVPVGKNNVVGSEFTNIVVNPTRGTRRKIFVAMSSQIIQGGVSIDVSDFPLDTVSFVIFKRNAGAHGTFVLVSNEVTFVAGQSRASIHSVVDTDVRKGNVYEYKCRLMFRDGTSSDTGRLFVDYEPLVENLVDTRIDDVNVLHNVDAYDVTFKVTSIVNESNMDSVKKLLERQGMLEFFSDDVLRERDKLQYLVAHQVYRVNLTLGVKENFGIITDEHFSDSRLRNINAVQPLHPGYKYRYEVVALLRAPETMFDDFSKTVVDSRTRRSYTFKPSKFLHPVTLTRGNIVSSQVLSEHYPQGQLSFGTVGNLVTTEVSFASNVSTVTNAVAEMVDPTTVVVKWNVLGDPKQIDHFVIIKEFCGQRDTVGKSHAIVDGNSFRFFHVLSKRDVGEITYFIVPVFDNYDIGTEAKTNSVRVTQ